MSDIVIYTTRRCPYCLSAKAWLKEKGYTFQEISLDNPSDRKSFIRKNPKMTTVPQVFFKGEAIGGFSDLIRSKLSF